MAELNAAVCLDTRAKENKNIKYLISSSGIQTYNLLHPTLVPLRHDWPLLGLSLFFIPNIPKTFSTPNTQPITLFILDPYNKLARLNYKETILNERR